MQYKNQNMQGKIKRGLDIILVNKIKKKNNS